MEMHLLKKEIKKLSARQMLDLAKFMQEISEERLKIGSSVGKSTPKSHHYART